MRKLVCHYVADEGHADRVYDLSDPVLGQDGRNKALHLLRSHLESLGVELHTQDLLAPEAADAVLFENMPAKDPYEKAAAVRALGKPMLLVASESIFIMPQNNDPKNYALFDHVFTYQDQMLDGKVFHKYNYTYGLPCAVPRGDFKRNKLLCCVAGNKRVNHAGELYSRRVEVIRWYEKHALELFDLYGGGWERPWKAAAPFFKRKVLHKWPFRPFFAPPFKSWRGRVESKNETMRTYRFALCFENASGVPGYITEKMFDAMMAGCVPVYWGAPNVAEHVPAECFIDYREIASAEALYTRLTSMSEAEHTLYMDAIDAFFNSTAANPFRYPFFVNMVSEKMCTALNVPFVPMKEGEYE